MGFPSKLTDYSAAALPILIHGPPWASAVQWALQEPDGALLVQETDPEPLKSALSKILRDPQFRLRLAQGAAAAGRKYFSAEAALGLFWHSLQTRAPVPEKPVP